jgi:SulP family sulfate permease
LGAQDVGIIFLSAMGSSVAALCLEAGRDAATAMGTALVAMTASTFLVGLGTLVVGEPSPRPAGCRARALHRGSLTSLLPAPPAPRPSARRHLAVFVQYIPLPVMGGYLGFVGYFCAASGVGLGASVEVDTLLSWGRLLGAAPLAKLAPTLASTALMIATLARFEHPLALPSVLVALVAAFHVALALAGVSLAQAAAAGWVLKPAAGAVKFWELWGLYNFRDWSLRGLYLPAVWRQGAKAAGLLLVVVFGSCMDIAAIAQESPAPLDFDRELLTVGASNVAVGLAGVGFTGSYIFSQTIFTMRAGVRSRVNGWVIAGAELAVFLIPYSVVQFLPNYFLGALLLWFGVEISRDWLVLSFYRLTGVGEPGALRCGAHAHACGGARGRAPGGRAAACMRGGAVAWRACAVLRQCPCPARAEYALLWVTFGSIMQWGLEGGVAAGIVSATLYFAVAYARSQVSSFAAAAARSTVVRTVEQQAALDLFWPTHAATARLQGFIFFGSAQSIGVKVEEAGRALAEAGAGSRAEREEHREAAIEHSMRSMGEDYAGGGKHDQAVAALDAAPKFMVLDFAKVTGLDSSGARTLAAAVRELAALGVAPVLTGAGHHGVAALLAAHDVRLRSTRWPPELRPAEGEEAALGGGGGGGGALAAAALEEGGGAGGAGEVEGEGEPEVLLFPTLEEGLRFCEDALLEVAVRHGLCAPPSQGLTLEALLAVHLDKLPLTSPANAPAMAAILRRYMQRRTARRGEVLWSVDDDADSLFVVEKGTLRVDQYRPASEAEDAAALAAAREAAAGAAGGAVPWAEAEVRGGAGPGGRAVRVRSFELGPGCVAGTTDFYLARPHGTQAVCATHACRVLWLSRHAMQRMAAEAPAALNVLQLVVMRANSSDLSAAADAAARVQ